MELKAQEAEAALAAIQARRMLAEARSTQASSRTHSRAPSVVAAEVEHFDITDPEDRNDNMNNPVIERGMNSPVIEHGEVILPIRTSSRVDQLRDFWSSLNRPNVTPRTPLPVAVTPPTSSAPPDALRDERQRDDARDRKIPGHPLDD